MGKPKRIPKREITSGSIPANATKTKDDNQMKFPVFSFKHVSENHCLLSDWQSAELIDLIKMFKTMESLTWNQVHSHKGLEYKQINNPKYPLPKTVSPDITICEVRACQKKRVFGYRIDNVFCVIWFDRNHEVCAEKRKA